MSAYSVSMAAGADHQAVHAVDSMARWVCVNNRTAVPPTQKNHSINAIDASKYHRTGLRAGKTQVVWVRVADREMVEPQQDLRPGVAAQQLTQSQSVHGYLFCSHGHGSDAEIWIEPTMALQKHLIPPIYVIGNEQLKAP